MSVGTKSLAERIARLPPAERMAVLADIDLDEIQHDPDFWLRPTQLEALRATEWLTMYMAGRGAGKTRTGAEWVREKAKTPGTRIALVARTAADVRDTMINGESGIMNICPPSEAPDHIPSVRRVAWPNGSMATTYSGEEPNQLRGPQFHAAWGDELAAWKLKPDNSGLTAWDNLQIATRLGANPQIFVTTTPKRVHVIRAITTMAKESPEKVRLIRGSTMDNAANLASAYVELIYSMYAGTSIEQQELHGVLLDAVEGALWQDDIIRHTLNLGDLPKPADRITVVGVDPTVAEEPGDECGIIVCASTKEKQLHTRNAWVLDDRSVKGSPDTWAKAVVQTAKDWNAIVVAEKNQGGALVGMAIRGVDPTVPFVLVSASKGKDIRAEPVVMAYEQKRVTHFGSLLELEDELTGWVPGESGYSPNRLDAAVWGLTALLVDRAILGKVGQIRGSHVLRGRRLAGVGERPGQSPHSHGGGMGSAPWRPRTG